MGENKPAKGAAMNKILDDIAYLSQEIGARPANTEEEQRAATYIQEVLERDAHLHAEIEEFNCNSHAGYARAIYCALTIIFVAISLAVPAMAIPALVISIIAAGCMIAESLGHPVLSRFFMRGISQNVVAKYEPPKNPEGVSARRRKVILVANYDSGKVRRDLHGPAAKLLAPLQMASLVAMIAVPVILLVHDFFFLHATGNVASVFMILTVIALVICALPILQVLATAIAPYNEAANSNASGVAVMLEAARMVGNNKIGTDHTSDEAVIHTPEEAVASGLIPDGASITYETPAVEDMTPAESLMAAKVAIAAMTGSPMSKRDMDIAKNLVNLREQAIADPSAEEMSQARRQTAEALSTVPADTLAKAKQNQAADKASDTTEPESGVETSDAEALAQQVVVEKEPEPSVPDWYTKAKASAKHKDDETPHIQRSRYAVITDYEGEDFLTAAQAIMGANTDLEPNMETEERIRELQADIMATQAPRAHECEDTAAQLEPVQSKVDEQTQPLVATDQLTQPQAPIVVETQAAKATGRYDRLYSVTDRDPMQYQPVQVSDAGNDATCAMPAVGSATCAMPSVQVGNLDLDALRGQSQQIPDQATQVIPQRAAAARQMVNPQGIDFVPGALNQAAIPDPLAPSAQSASDEFKQRAPLAFLGDDYSQQAAKELLAASLPSILPEINPIDEPSAPSAVSTTSSFAPLETSGAGTSVGDELLADVDPDDIYVDDADDAVFEDEFTETGAFAGPGYVEMPQSRIGKFFGRFGRKKKEQETSASDWLGVDDNFDARQVGKERGGWESFRDENDWQGGAFSNRDVLDEDRSAGLNTEGFEGSTIEQGQDFLLGVTPDAQNADEMQYEEQMQDIYSFASGDLNIEVWFVALGSELAENSGTKAFLAEHADEMRGAVLVNLESMGDGPLCYLEKEGFIKHAVTPSRMKRFIKQAVHTSGVRIDPARVPWRESASSIANKHRMQAVTLAGMDGVKPAGFGDSHDSIEAIDSEALEYNTRYVVELLKSI